MPEASITELDPTSPFLLTLQHSQYCNGARGIALPSTCILQIGFISPRDIDEKSYKTLIVEDWLSRLNENEDH